MSRQMKRYLIKHTFFDISIMYNQYQTIWSLLVPGLECWPPRPGPSPSSPPPSPSWPAQRSRRRSPGAAGPPPVHRTVLYMRDERGYAVIMFNQQCHIYQQFIHHIHVDCPQGWKYCCSLLHTASAHQKPGRIWGLLKTLCVLTALFPTSVLFSMKRLMRVVLPTPRSPTTYTRHVFSTLITSQG